MSSGFVISFVEADRDWARWIVYQAGDLGVPVQLGLPVGSNRAVEFRRLLDDGHRVIAVVSADSVADQEVLDQWRWAIETDPAGVERRLLPVFVAPCEAPELAELTPLRLHDMGDETAAADRLRDALGLSRGTPAPPAFPGAQQAIMDSFTRVEHLLDKPPERTNQLLVSTDDPLPRLRRLSDQARFEAGALGSVAGEADAFNTGLYVTRDIEQRLVGELTSDAVIPHVVRGEAGAGKTSLLWGIATRLLAQGDHEVFLLKATWLRHEAAGPTAVDAALITAALEQVQGAKTILVDTADLVVRDEQDRLALVSVVESAIHGGASVLVTSRIAEARLLPPGWHQTSLGDYEVESPGEGLASEFERAVAAHSRLYSPSAQSGREMAEQLISAVARRQPLRRLCLGPLTMRMLFELYAPAMIPENVDVTGLYEAYWHDRVVRDRRVWAAEITDGITDRDEDLTSTATLLARRMLEEGSPEIPVPGVFDPAESGRIRRRVDLLVHRGVGELVKLGSVAGFRFFHQTFFEFAAAQAILEAKRASAMDLIEQRTRAHADDYLLLAVFEQAWLCAWRDDDLHAAAENLAARMLDELLVDLGASENHSFPYSLQRTVLAVVAQSPRLPDMCREKFAAVMEKAGLPVVRDTLALMPPPQRAWTEADSGVIARCAARRDAAWIAVLNVVRRLVYSDAAVAMTAMRLLDLSKRASQMPTKELVAHPELSGLLIDLLPHDPPAVLDELERFCRVVVAARAFGYLASLLRGVLDVVGDLPGKQVAEWFDSVLDPQGERLPGVGMLHVAAHRQRVLRQVSEGGWECVVEELEEVLAKIAENPPVTPRDGARLGGLLTALADHGPTETFEPVADALGKRSEPHVLAELHRGWLVGYARRSPNVMLDRWVAWLAQGLPASHHSPETPAQRWADTIRRNLERPDVPARVAAQIAVNVTSTRAAPDSNPWLDVDELLRLVARAASEGVLEAQAAIQTIGEGFELKQAGVRSFLQQAVAGDVSTAEVRELVDVLLRLGEAGYLCQLFEKHPVLAGELPRSRLDEFWQLVARCLGSSRAPKRRDGARLLHLLVLRGGIPQPKLITVTRFLDDSTDVAVRKALITVLELGLQKEVYPPEFIRRQLGNLVETAWTERGSAADLQEARAVLVVAIAKWGSPEDAHELLELAFREPVSSTVLAKVSSYTRASHRLGENHAELPGTDFLTEFGMRLRGVHKRARKDTAVRWRGAIAEVVARSDAADLVRTLDVLSDLEERFGESIVLQLEPQRYPEVKQRMHELLADAAAGDVVKRAIRKALAERSGHTSTYSWPELDLGGVAVRGDTASPASDELFDVAVSFCGSQREYVKSLVEACQRLDVRVFYDQSYTVRLWGKNFIYEMREIYGGKRARHFIPIISDDYFTASYPRDEFDAASRHAIERPDDPYILPLLIGDVTIPERLLSPAIAHLRVENYTVDELARIIADRVRPAGNGNRLME
ncbi:toll/interleukin-1 receptor domain-containing protein [Amycolatopsis japonica]|uniref:toll/interleukin-1 receptor domain-containing protein n=1 Tax=Amycolatopsis japonica TaxID=208439 RepID=UPI00331A440A